MLKTSGETVDGAGMGICGWYEVEEECRRIEVGRCKHCCMDEVESLTFIPIICFNYCDYYNNDVISTFRMH